MFLFEYIYFLIVTRDSGILGKKTECFFAVVEPSSFRLQVWIHCRVYKVAIFTKQGKNHDKCVLMFKKSQIKFLLSKEFCRILFQLITSYRTSTNDAPQTFVEKHCNKKHINLTEEKSITKCVYIHVKGDEESPSHIIKGTFRTDCTHPRNYDFHYHKHKVE